MSEFLLVIFAFLFGWVASYLSCRWLIEKQPRYAATLGLVDPAKNIAATWSVQPVVNPFDLPTSITKEEIEEQIGRVPTEGLRRALRALACWEPRRHQDEDKFHRSFERHLIINGYLPSEVEHEPRVYWTARDADATEEDRFARPDFTLCDEVLVELKRSIVASGTSDRAMGQMLRYLLAWRSKGTALLVICNDYDDNLRAYIDRYVNAWKAQGVPIMACFVREKS